MPQLVFSSARRFAIMALSSGTRLGPYEIQSPLGAGGMGEVYRARDTRLDRAVAIKILPSELSADPERRKRLSRCPTPTFAPCTMWDIRTASISW